LGSLRGPWIEHSCGIPAVSDRNSTTCYHFTIFVNDSGLRLAPPTRAPSISSCESNWFAFSGLTLPP